MIWIGADWHQISRNFFVASRVAGPKFRTNIPGFGDGIGLPSGRLACEVAHRGGRKDGKGTPAIVVAAKKAPGVAAACQGCER